jgi:hypothetical protein
MKVKSSPLARVELMPNEHALGPLGRLHLYSSYRSIKASLSHVTNDIGAMKSGTIWRAAYDDVHKYWARERTKDDFLTEHTLLNYYYPFLPDKEKEKLKLQTHLMPVSSIVIRNVFTWRICPECVVADSKKYGIAYFHVDHQLPVVTRCEEHLASLRSGCGTCSSEWKHLEIIRSPAPVAKCSSCQTQLNSTDGFWDEDIEWFSASSRKLLRGEIQGITLKKLQVAYRMWIGIGPRTGVLSSKERDIVKAAQRKLDNHFDFRLYRKVFTNVTNNAQKKRYPSLSLHKAAFKEQAYLHPAVHLLLIRFMFGEFELIPT